jgi:lipopolysaccharide assembly outer membrane protein LptD (OstA)
MNFIFVLCIFFTFNNLFGQEVLLQNKNDSISLLKDSLLWTNDSLNYAVDSLSVDTLLKSSSKKISPDAIESSVKYISQDSIIINLKNRKIFLFEDAKAYYDDIELYAGFIEFGFTNSELYASGVADSCGHLHGSPVFKQNENEFSSQEIRYNFKTKKGKVSKVITEEGEGYIHGHYVKHVDDKTSYVYDGQYTTCNLEHPHFQIRFKKAKVIQNDKIITGPAYLSFGNVPSPIAIPFSYFPLHKERASGIILPKFGSGAVRGFYFERFGYYFGISDNFDLFIGGDISTRLWWAAIAEANYVFRYKCMGSVKLRFGQTFIGERGTKEYSVPQDFRVYWKHNQDPKSHPVTKFNAEINVISNTYNKYNASSTSDYLSNQFNSSLSLSTNVRGVFYLDGAITYNQNTLSRNINIALPNMNMYVNQFYPFRKKFKAGKLKWYDNISMRWGSQISNQINTQDTLFLLPQTWKELRSDMQHTVPLTVPVKMGKFNWNNNATFTEKWFLQRTEKKYETEWLGEDSMVYNLTDVFRRGFYALHDLSLSTSLTTKIFGTYGFRKGVFCARHVMSPDLNFTFRPNLNGNAYGTYFDPITGQEVEYSYFGGSSKMQAITRFMLSNNLEIKVKSKKDTITGTRKITIFDNLTVSCAYDFAADSLRWRPLTISGRTSLFSFLDLTFLLGFDPYIIDERGISINQTELKVNKRAMRFSSSDLRVALNWRLNQDFFKGKKKNANPVNNPSPENSFGMSDIRPDFTNPWNITINYIFSYNVKDNQKYYQYEASNKYQNTIYQTVNLAADVSITRKWKVQVMTGFDIQNKEFTHTTISIYRDLHCWEMKLDWIPFGPKKEWKFQINVKASVLQDLKYNLQRDFRDNIN